MQLLINVQNKRGQLYSDISEDGVIGNQTLNAIQIMIEAHKKNLLYRVDSNYFRAEELAWFHFCEKLRALQFAWYVDIAKRKEEQEKWFDGWSNRIAFPPKFYRFNYETEQPE